MSNLLLRKIFPGNNASVNSSCTQPPPPPPPPGLLRGICPLCQSRGVGHLQNLLCGGGRAFTDPGVIPKLLTRMQFPIQINYTEDFTGKTSTLAHLSRTRKIEEGFKGMFSISCLLFFHGISSQNHMVKSEAIRT